MITVSILINGKAIFTRSACRKEAIGKQGDREMYEYHIDTGEKIGHWYDEGAVVLAKKLLDTIKEV